MQFKLDRSNAPKPSVFLCVAHDPLQFMGWFYYAKKVHYFCTQRRVFCILRAMFTMPSKWRVLEYSVQTPILF